VVGNPILQKSFTCYRQSHVIYLAFETRLVILIWTLTSEVRIYLLLLIVLIHFLLTSLLFEVLLTFRVILRFLKLWTTLFIPSRKSLFFLMRKIATNASYSTRLNSLSKEWIIKGWLWSTKVITDLTWLLKTIKLAKRMQVPEWWSINWCILWVMALSKESSPEEFTLNLLEHIVNRVSLVTKIMIVLKVLLSCIIVQPITNIIHCCLNTCFWWIIRWQIMLIPSKRRRICWVSCIVRPSIVLICMLITVLAKTINKLLGFVQYIIPKVRITLIVVMIVWFIRSSHVEETSESTNRLLLFFRRISHNILTS